MKILVEDKVVDTKDIADIVDVEANKRMFLNRGAGFKIIFLDNSEMVFKEDIPYERTSSQIAEVKNKWSDLQDKVTVKWQSDKTEIEQFKV